MRLVTFDAGNGPRPGALLGDEIKPIEAASVQALLEQGPVEHLSTDAAPLARANVALLPPVARPDKIICMWLNYHDHAEEAHQEVPEHRAGSRSSPARSSATQPTSCCRRRTPSTSTTRLSWR